MDMFRIFKKTTERTSHVGQAGKSDGDCPHFNPVSKNFARLFSETLVCSYANCYAAGGGRKSQFPTYVIRALARTLRLYQKLARTVRPPAPIFIR